MGGCSREEPHLGGWLCWADIECVSTGPFRRLSGPMEKDLLRAGPSLGPAPLGTSLEGGLDGAGPLGELCSAGA